jgi:membrane protein YqaA with SNARE-associated domain
VVERGTLCVHRRKAGNGVTEMVAVWGDGSIAWTLIAVFVACAIAGSFIPISSEVAVAAAAMAGVPITLLIVVATVGNVIGACVNYATGRLGADWWRRRRTARAVGLDDVTTDVRSGALERRVRLWVDRWGAVAMVMSWLPVVGDPLTMVAGVMGVAFVPFLVWVTVGKAARYLAVVGATGAIFGSPGW